MSLDGYYFIVRWQRGTKCWPVWAVEDPDDNAGSIALYAERKDAEQALAEMVEEDKEEGRWYEYKIMRMLP